MRPAGDRLCRDPDSLLGHKVQAIGSPSATMLGITDAAASAVRDGRLLVQNLPGFLASTIALCDAS